MAINYLKPKIAKQVNFQKIPLVKANAKNLKGYGKLVSDYKNFDIEIVTWPKPTGRPVDEDTGNEAGTKSGTFEFVWKGDMFYGHNKAVGSEYLLGWSKTPDKAKTSTKTSTTIPEHVLLWHANYHPDGGQLFFPLAKTPFIVPLALPTDDIAPEQFIAFYFDGTQGLYIHPNVWHEGIFSLVPKAKFYDIQGAVHARVSVFFAQEFNVLLQVPLQHL